MIPVMLLVLGLQLARTRALRITADVLLATGLRLLAAPALAAVLAAPFGLDGVVRAVGILQAGMPVAILVAIIANDYAIEPELVMTTVFFSTVVSLPTLTVLLAAV
jgi:predicted permease